MTRQLPAWQECRGVDEIGAGRRRRTLALARCRSIAKHGHREPRTTGRSGHSLRRGAAAPRESNRRRRPSRTAPASSSPPARSRRGRLSRRPAGPDTMTPNSQNHEVARIGSSSSGRLHVPTTSSVSRSRRIRGAAPLTTAAPRGSGARRASRDRGDHADRADDEGTAAEEGDAAAENRAGRIARNVPASISALPATSSSFAEVLRQECVFDRSEDGGMRAQTEERAEENRHAAAARGPTRRAP